MSDADCTSGREPRSVAASLSTLYRVTVKRDVRQEEVDCWRVCCCCRLALHRCTWRYEWSSHVNSVKDADKRVLIIAAADKLE